MSPYSLSVPRSSGGEPSQTGKSRKADSGRKGGNNRGRKDDFNFGLETESSKLDLLLPTQFFPTPTVCSMEEAKLGQEHLKPTSISTATTPYGISPPQDRGTHGANPASHLPSEHRDYLQHRHCTLDPEPLSPANGADLSH